MLKVEKSLDIWFFSSEISYEISIFTLKISVMIFISIIWETLYAVTLEC